MRNIYLPNLKKIKIQNFSLYPNGLSFEYDFINGVNLIMGGNGMGKTTFVNIIRYAIIGDYKTNFDMVRTYRGKKIEGRRSYPKDYYKNRQDSSLILEEKPKVVIHFELNKNYFVVERCLEDIKLQSVTIDGKKILGKVVTQADYDALDDEENRKNYLNYKYEQEINTVSEISFDDLIFFVNEILFFGEEHKTILWNKNDSNVQNELFNKYFNEPVLDFARQEAERNAKYYDSLSRHNSEDIRAITKVLKGIEQKESDDIGTSVNSQLILLRESIEKLDIDIDSKQSERQNVEDQIRILNNSVNKYTQEESVLEKKKKNAEYKKLGGEWKKLHKNYELYFQNLKVNEACPMCNQSLDEIFVQNKVDHSENCFLCEQHIFQDEPNNLTVQFEEIKKQVSENYNKIINTQKRINEEEKLINKLDNQYRKLATKKRELQSKLRRLEHDSQKSNGSVDKLQSFYDEVDRLQRLKDENQEKSKEEKQKAEEISNKIESHIAEITNKFSMLFSEFAERFLGVKCKLSFMSIGKEDKRFYPNIDGTVRTSEDELSESQRFFVDHSFRMSILSFFYTKPTFYIVETPNSSLDISYEQNAAKVFAKFLEKPNTLIITTNLNNSGFLEYLLKATSKVSYVDLLEIGKRSDIQNNNQSIKIISEKIKNQINGR